MLISFVLTLYIDLNAICCLQANLEILVTDLKRSTEELHLAPFFPRSAVISFPTAADGTRLGYARVLFQNLDDKLRVGGYLSFFFLFFCCSCSDKTVPDDKLSVYRL